MLTTLAWRNLWRNRNRSLITMSSVGFAVLLSVFTDAWQTGVFDHLIKNVVGFYSGYIQVHQKDFWEEQSLENTMSLHDDLLQKITANENVANGSPRIETFMLASSGDNTTGCMMVGIVPEKEAEIIQLKKHLKSGDFLNSDDNGVLIGSGLAEKLQLQLNDSVILLGQGYHGSNAAGKYRIQGMVEFGSPELNNRMLFMPLSEAQYLLDARDIATTIVLSLHETKKMNATQQQLASALSEEYEVMTWEEMMPEIIEHIKTDKGSGVIISLMLYFLVSFGIFSTLLMMMAERKFELGMLLAIGMKKFQLVKMMLLESFFITITGALAGIAISIPLVYYFSVYPLRFTGEMAEMYKNYGFEPTMPTSTDPIIFLKQTGIIIIVSLLLGAYPVYKVLVMDAVTSMKK
jgi:putative ABC transport system permease protein